MKRRAKKKGYWWLESATPPELQTALELKHEEIARALSPKALRRELVELRAEVSGSASPASNLKLMVFKRVFASRPDTGCKVRVLSGGGTGLKR